MWIVARITVAWTTERSSSAAVSAVRRKSSRRLQSPMKGGRNFTYYANPDYDKLVNEAMTTTERDRELKIERQAAELVWRDAALIVHGRIVDKFVARKDVKGFVYLGDRVSFRYYDMYRER